MIPLDEYIVRNTILFLLWAEFIWETYLSIRQVHTLKIHYYSEIISKNISVQ